VSTDTCTYCSNIPDEGELCSSCRDKLGLVLGSGTRPPLPCQRCNHPDHVRALARELTASPGESGDREAHPMGVTLEPIASRSFFRDRPDGVERGKFAAVHGILDMYVCLKCGLTEWYCRDPRSIPIGEEYGTEHVSVEGPTPYR
jgi:hypothetical protein